MHNLKIIFAGILLVTSCNTINSSTTKKIEKENPSLHLNQGKKWIANKETQIGMENLQKLIDEINDSTNIDELAVKMKKENQFIIKNCNMKGEEHDQLHIVLIPILNETDALNGADGTEANKMRIDRIQKSLGNYFSHFNIK